MAKRNTKRSLARKMIGSGSNRKRVQRRMTNEAEAGQEPNWKNFNLGRGLNWLNVALDPSDGKKEYLSWLENNKAPKAEISGVKLLSEHVLYTQGKIAYILSREGKLDEDIVERFNVRREKFKEEGAILLAEKKKNDKEQSKLDAKEPPYTAASITAQETCELKDFVEDHLYDADYKEALKEFQGLIRDKKQKVLKDASERIKQMSEELNEFGSNDQVTEAYEHLGSKRNVNKIIKFIDEIVITLETQLQNTKATRKPRKKAPKSADKIVKGIKYKPNDKEYNLVSVSPEQIVGAKAVLVFHTKYRKIGIYEASTTEGLLAKGASLTNFSEEKSIQKTLRDTKNAPINNSLAEFRKGTLTKARKQLENLNSLETKMNGRLGNDVVIMKVFK